MLTYTVGRQREKGKPDGIEQFNFYSSQFDDLSKIPECVRPLMDEVSAFVNVRCEVHSNR